MVTATIDFHCTKYCALWLSLPRTALSKTAKILSVACLGFSEMGCHKIKHMVLLYTIACQQCRIGSYVERVAQVQRALHQGHQQWSSQYVRSFKKNPALVQYGNLSGVALIIIAISHRLSTSCVQVPSRLWWLIWSECSQKCLCHSLKCCALLKCHLNCLLSLCRVKSKEILLMVWWKIKICLCIWRFASVLLGKDFTRANS